MMFAFASLLSFFTAGNKRSNRSEGFFLSFSRTKPLLPLHGEGRTAERRHGRAWACSAGEEHCLAACGVMVCSPYNCREADWLAPAWPLLLRCATTGSLAWGPGGWARSYASPRHSLPWPPSRWTLRYAGWR